MFNGFVNGFVNGLVLALVGTGIQRAGDYP